MKILIAFLFLSTSIFSQITNQVDDNGNKQGLWRGQHPDSKRLRYEGVFEHGVEKGLFKFFDDTAAGTVIATREFNGTTCTTIFYNQKGNKVSEGMVVNKKFEGEWIYYHENSKQIMTSEFYRNGNLEGIKKVYYLSGKIAQETNFKNGLKDGSDTHYAENGTVIEEVIYKKNEFDGPAIFRSPSNIVVAKGLFSKGKKVGVWEFNTNGKKTKENYNFQSKRKFAKRTSLKKE